MLGQVGAPGKGLSTVLADVRLFTSVCPPVLNEVGALSKRLSAVRAGVGTLACVDTPVAH